MNDLQVIQNNGVEVVDSREVAEMIGKNHKELLRDIRNYAAILRLMTSSSNPATKIASAEPSHATSSRKRAATW